MYERTTTTDRLAPVSKSAGGLNSALDLLGSAYGLLRQPGRFTAECMCADRIGRPVSFEHASAYAFDISGGLWHLARGGSRSAAAIRNEALQALNDAARQAGYADIFRAQRHGQAVTVDLIEIAGLALKARAATTQVAA
jgi:hypothetical protein